METKSGEELISIAVISPCTECGKRFDELKRIQKDALKEVIRMKRDMRKRRMSNMNSNQMNMNNMLMLGIVFAVGYMIGKK